MIRPICKDPFLLSQKAKEMTEEDRELIRDLKDTLQFHSAHCLGMAAHMIGVPKALIAFREGPLIKVILNGEILEKKGPYPAMEGCLSVSGSHSVTRYREIRVRYQDENFAEHVQTFQGLTAQILQHELDHCKGILV